VVHRTIHRPRGRAEPERDAATLIDQNPVPQAVIEREFGGTRLHTVTKLAATTIGAVHDSASDSPP
jgi:hypothetical protein